MKKIIKEIILGVLIITTALLGGLSLTGCSSSKVNKIGIPNDATNQGRAIKLLESAGFIEVDPAAGFTPELKDVTKYIYDIEIVPTNANTLTTLLEDYAACIINGTFATAYGLLPSKDAILIEKQIEGSSNPFINIICSKTTDKNNETYKIIVEAFHSQTVAEYILAKFNEAYFPAFEYDETTNTTGIIETINNYNSSKDGKKIVKLGVCGAANTQWDAVQYVLDKQDAKIYIDQKEFSAYNLPNEALNSGDIDLNSFQHYAYFENDCKQNNYDLTAIGETLIAPLSVYSKQSASLDALKESVGLN